MARLTQAGATYRSAWRAAGEVCDKDVQTRRDQMAWEHLVDEPQAKKLKRDPVALGSDGLVRGYVMLQPQDRRRWNMAGTSLWRFPLVVDVFARIDSTVVAPCCPFCLLL